MKKSFLILFLILGLIALSSKISLAENTASSHINSTPQIIDKGVFHLEKYKTDTPITALGFVNNRLLVSFSSTEHAWFFNNSFAPVNGNDPAKALGYPSMQTAESFLTVPKTSPCAKFKDAVSAVSITNTKNLCLSSSTGGDFTLHLLPAAKDKPIAIGYGKHPMLEKTRVTWVGYDGNLYIAHIHPSLFADDVTVLKEKTSPTVFLLRNGVRYSIPDEKTFYTWFDSFKSVSVIDAKKLASYPLIGKANIRANTVIQFSDAPDLYIFQSANDAYQVFGKDVKITEEKPDKWILPDPKNKKSTIELLKRPVLLRKISVQSDLMDTFGPTWTTHVLTLDPKLRSTFTISDKPFIPVQDILFE